MLTVCAGCELPQPALFKTKTFHETMKSGEVLCRCADVAVSCSFRSLLVLDRMVDKIKPGCIDARYLRPTTIAYKQMENIGQLRSAAFFSCSCCSVHPLTARALRYLKVCTALGLNTTDLFDTPDLFEKKNMVRHVIFAVVLRRSWIVIKHYIVQGLVVSNIHVLARHAMKVERGGPLMCTAASDT